MAIKTFKMGNRKEETASPSSVNSVMELFKGFIYGNTHGLHTVSTSVTAKLNYGGQAIDQYQSLLEDLHANGYKPKEISISKGSAAYSAAFIDPKLVDAVYEVGKVYAVLIKGGFVAFVSTK